MKLRPHPDVPGALTFASQERPEGWVEDLPVDPEEPTRTLYHFTSTMHMPLIMGDGIARGDVALSPTTGYNAPWLTDDDSWHRQNWAVGTAVDKTEVRISVDVPANSPLLVPWLEIVKEENVPDYWVQALDKVGGGGEEHWYVFKGRIPRTWISGIAVRHDRSLRGKWGIKAKPTP